MHEDDKKRTELVQKECVPCEGGVEPFSREDAEQYMDALPEWRLNETAEAVTRTFSFKDFKGAIAFVNTVADIAESEGHHPDIAINYNKVHISLSTHAIGGLSENDFIVAAKIDSQIS